MWTPLEFKHRVASVQILIDEDRAIESRFQTDWTHRTWIRVHGRYASFSSKSSYDSFVDFISMEVCVSRSR